MKLYEGKCFLCSGRRRFLISSSNPYTKRETDYYVMCPRCKGSGRETKEIIFGPLKRIKKITEVYINNYSIYYYNGDTDKETKDIVDKIMQK